MSFQPSRNSNSNVVYWRDSCGGLPVIIADVYAEPCSHIRCRTPSRFDRSGRSATLTRLRTTHLPGRYDLAG